MAQTRSVFALMEQCGCLLLLRRAGEGAWGLPGGKVNEGESDADALIRMMEPSGLKIWVQSRIGEPLACGEDTMLAYRCTFRGGELVKTTESHYRYCSEEEIRQGRYLVPHWEEICDGYNTFVGYKSIPLQPVQPEEQMLQMILRGFVPRGESYGSL